MAQTFLAKSTNTTYVCLQDLKTDNVNPDFFKGCGTSIRACLKKNNIPENEIIFVDKNKVSNKKNTRAQPYVTEKYAKEWIYDVNKIKEYRESIKTQKKEELNKTRIEQKQYDVTQLQPLPPIVEISDEEAFKDTDGNILHIEMRGEKTQEGLYMKALDIQNKLGIDRVYDVVTNTNSDHEYNTHYVFFETKNYGIEVDQKSTKVLFLTYFGVIKLLICSRSKKAEHFQKWAITTLFTHQFGDQEDKDDLAADLMGITPKTLYNVFRRSSNTIPCVYLFRIGRVGDVREYCKKKIESINLDGYDDNDMLYKFGKTDDLARRTKEHANTYGKMSKDFTLETFNYIDKALACKAESSINHFFTASDMRIKDSKHAEVVVIKQEKLKYVIEWFKNVQILYSGNSFDLIKQLDTLKHQHAVEIMQKDHEYKLLLKENEKIHYEHKSELQALEIELLKTKLSLV